MDVRERWGSAAFTHTLSQVNWMASTAVLMHLNERATGDPARDWLNSWAHRFFHGDGLRVLVLGCGEGWLERGLAKWPFVSRIDATDIAADAVARAREAAGPKQNYSVLDLNRDELEPAAYDVVVAHSILHHVENLPHAFREIERALKPEATLIVNEYTGPDRFQFDDRVLALINGLLGALPPQFRRGAVESRTYERKERPSREFMIEHDPSEAVRAAELLPMLRDRFEVLEEKLLGGTILMHLLYDIVQNFRFEIPAERALIEMLGTFEGALVDAGRIGSDFTMLAARKKGAALPRSAFTRPLPPRPDAARDVERDPLQMSGRAALRRTGGRALLLNSWMMRMLRVVLLSTKERRANLFEESVVYAARERLRYAFASRDPVAWMVARGEAHGIDPVVRSLLVRIGELSLETGLIARW